MMVYILLIALLLLLGIVYQLLGKHHNKLAQLIVCLVGFLALFLLSSLKNVNVGRDTLHYLEAYQNIAKLSWTHLSYNSFELGFVLLNKVCASIHLPYKAFAAICYFVVYAPIGYVVYKRSDHPVMSMIYIISFLLSFLLSGLRQSMAMSICLLAMHFLLTIKKKSIRSVVYVLIVLIAALFHKTALIALLLLPFSFLRFRPAFLIVLVPSLLVSFFMSKGIYETLSYTFFSSSYLPGAYGGGGLFFAFLILFLMVVVLRPNGHFNELIEQYSRRNLEGRKKLTPPCFLVSDRNQPLENVAIWCAFLSAFFQSFTRVNQVFPRLGFYFLLFGAIAWPYVISRVRSTTLKWVLVIGFSVGLIGYFVLTSLLTKALEMVPYYF